MNVITPALCCCRGFFFFVFFLLRVDGDNSASQLLHRRWHDAVTQPLVCLPPALTQSHSIDRFGTGLTSTRDDWRCHFSFLFLINSYPSLTDATRKGKAQIVESSRPLVVVIRHHFRLIFPGSVNPLFLPSHHLKDVEFKETGNGLRI